MDKVVVTCESCDKTYDVSKLEPGKRFRCKGCEAVLQVPAAAEAEEASPQRVRRVGTNVGHPTRRKPLPTEGPTVSGDPGVVGAGHGSSYRNEPARTGRRGTPVRKLDARAKKGNPTVLWGSIAAVVVVAAGALFFLNQGKDQPKGGAAAGERTSEARQPEAPQLTPDQIARNEFSRLEAEALRKTSDAAAVQAALAFAKEHEEIAPEGRLRDLYRRWIEIDAQAAEPNEALGNKLWEDDDRWVDAAEYARLAEEKRKANDPFHIAAREIIETQLKDTVGAVQTPFDFYYDDPELVPRPYLLAVENDGSTSTDIVAKEVGKNALFVLYTMFRDEYEGLFKLEPITKPVPVFVFIGEGGYEKWRQDGREDLPPSKQVGGFYSSSWQSQGRGLLHVWRFEGGRDPMPVYFHEGTHQLMDYYGRRSFGSRDGKTPWFQEGIAEYWGGVRRVVEGGKFRYLIGQPNDSRMGRVRTWSSADEGRMSIKELLAIDYDKFQEARAKQDTDAKAGQLVDWTYALGWVIIDYCLNNLSDDTLRDGMRAYMQREIQGTGGGDVLAELLHLETDEDFSFFEEDLAGYIQGELTKRWYESRGEGGR